MPELVQSHLSSVSSVKGRELGKAYPLVATGYIAAAPPTPVQKHPETIKGIKYQNQHHKDEKIDFFLTKLKILTTDIGEAVNHYFAAMRRREPLQFFLVQKHDF